MSHLKQSVSIVALSLACSPLLFAQESDEGDERRLKSVTVTATKRSEDAQSIPVAVSALGEQDLEAFGIKNFTDYLVQLPGVTAGGSGPGQATIYIRGLASTTPNLTTAGVAGLAPNVSFYLDEQPLAQPGRNLDVYTADLQRIEVLSGPQGTLFGSSSQAGTVRLITNKPDLNGFSAYQKASTSFTDGGEMSNSVEAMLNVPFNDRFALRGVVYTDKQGGDIDNVHGTIDAKESARFRKQNASRANGVPVSEGRRGAQHNSNINAVDFLKSDNSGLVEDNFNDTIYSGFRLSGLYELDENGKILVSHSRQRLDSEGVFFADPNLEEDYSIERHSDDNFEDSFQNTSWTIDRRIGELEALYTGAFTERTTDQIVDYTDYLFVGQYLPYYICDASVYASASPNPYQATGTCQPPNLFVKSLTETKVQTHELRVNTPVSNQYRATVGAFFSDLELTELNDFTYPGSLRVRGYDGTTVGFADNYPLTNTTAVKPTAADNKQGAGYYSHPGPFPAGVIFRNDIRRTDKQLGVFGEVSYDFTDEFAVTFGARWYDIEVDLEGSANSSFGNKADAQGNKVDKQQYGTNISTQFAANNADGRPDKASKDGMIFKLSGSWTPQDDLLFYATYSEGFRQGLLNRPGGATNSNNDFVVPFLILSDEVKNYDFGWKTELFNNSLRFNGSAFFVQVEGLQTTIFDPSITNLFFSDNAANAEIQGLEGDFTWVPESVEGLTLSGAFSFLNTEITEVLTPTDDVKKGEPLAFAPSYQFNLQARYEWDLEQEFAGSFLTAHFMPQLIMSDSSFSDIIEINKIESDGYVMIGGTLGVTADNWSAEIFATNLTNENAIISNNFVFDRERATPARPRTIGIRMSYDF